MNTINHSAIRSLIENIKDDKSKILDMDPLSIVRSVLNIGQTVDVDTIVDGLGKQAISCSWYNEFQKRIVSTTFVGTIIELSCVGNDWFVFSADREPIVNSNEWAINLTVTVHDTESLSTYKRLLGSIMREETKDGVKGVFRVINEKPIIKKDAVPPKQILVAGDVVVIRYSVLVGDGGVFTLSFNDTKIAEIREKDNFTIDVGKWKVNRSFTDVELKSMNPATFTQSFELIEGETPAENKGTTKQKPAEAVPPKAESQPENTEKKDDEPEFNPDDVVIRPGDRVLFERNGEEMIITDLEHKRITAFCDPDIEAIDVSHPYEATEDITQGLLANGTISDIMECFDGYVLPNAETQNDGQSSESTSEAESNTQEQDDAEAPECEVFEDQIPAGYLVEIKVEDGIATIRDAFTANKFISFDEKHLTDFRQSLSHRYIANKDINLRGDDQFACIVELVTELIDASDALSTSLLKEGEHVRLGFNQTNNVLEIMRADEESVLCAVSIDKAEVIPQHDIDYLIGAEWVLKAGQVLTVIDTFVNNKQLFGEFVKRFDLVLNRDETILIPKGARVKLINHEKDGAVLEGVNVEDHCKRVSFAGVELGHLEYGTVYCAKDDIRKDDIVKNIGTLESCLKVLFTIPGEGNIEVKSDLPKPVGTIPPQAVPLLKEHDAWFYLNMLFGTGNPTIMHVLSKIKEDGSDSETFKLTGSHTVELIEVFPDYTFSIIRMKDGCFYRIFLARTEMSLGNGMTWMASHNMPDRWVKLIDISDRETNHIAHSRRLV